MLADLKSLDGWPEKVKLMQNWIGKSYGCEINFEIVNNKEKFIFTRPDTIFGASFIALSVDHPLSKKFNNDEDFKKFKNECNKTGTTEEVLVMAEKLGFNSNYKVKHPFIDKKIPIYLQTLSNGFGTVYLWMSARPRILTLQKNIISNY